MNWVRWVNRIITHNKDKDGDFGIRMLMHIPIGILMATPILGIGLVWLFREYENNEDFWVKDVAFKDYYGAIFGYVLGTLGYIVLLILFFRG